MTSLRRTLVVTLVAAVSVATAAGAVGTYGMARREIDAVSDYHLRQLALSLRDEALGLRGATPRGRPDVDFVVQIFSSQGDLLYASRTAHELPPPLLSLGLATFEGGRSRWRVCAVPLGADVLQVAQPLEVRTALAVGAALRTLWPLLVLLPVLALAVWGLVGKALAPLDRIARGAAERTPASLAPFATEGVPDEVVPLVRSLNALLARLDAALAAQRAFVADAAHELRTPLAALKLQAQLASRAADPAERAAAMRDLDAGLSRATHVVAQLLALARAEPGEPEAIEDVVPLAGLVAQAVADHAPLAEARRVDLGATRVDEGAAVRGDAGALRTLLANLVDNAIRYTPPGGRVDVAAGAAGGRAFLEVADTGPGIPAEDRARVFDRFYRRPGAGEGGSGLGLAIVKAVAQRHGATVTLDDAPSGGLRARVELTAVPVAPDLRTAAGAAHAAASPPPREAGSP